MYEIPNILLKLSLLSSSHYKQRSTYETIAIKLNTMLHGLSLYPQQPQN